MLPLHPQDPAGLQGTTAVVLNDLQTMTWVDHTALAVLLVFFVIGLFKGLIWQVSRVGILLASYVVSCRFGSDVARMFARTPALGGQVPDPAGTASVAPSETTLYLAYVVLFLLVLIGLSLLAILLQRLAAKAGLTFFDRLGGGVLGVATGSCVVLFGLFVVHMFFDGSPLAQAAEKSYSRKFSQKAIDLLGERVPDELRAVFDLPALRVQGPFGLPVLPGLPTEPMPAPTPIEPR